jgi:hypothetical protein
MDLHCDGLFLEYLGVPVPVSSHQSFAFLSHSSTTNDMHSEQVKVILLSDMARSFTVKLENTFGEMCSEYIITSSIRIV